MIVTFDSKTKNKLTTGSKMKHINRHDEQPNNSTTSANDGSSLNLSTSDKNYGFKSSFALSLPELNHTFVNNSPIDSSNQSAPLQSLLQIVEDAADFSRPSKIKRSRGGCITCKVRKKKCDEGKPICDQCKRLKKDCTWIDKDMSEKERRERRKKVELGEMNKKLRKRKMVSKTRDLESYQGSESPDFDDNKMVNPGHEHFQPSQTHIATAEESRYGGAPTQNITAATGSPLEIRNKQQKLATGGNYNQSKMFSNSTHPPNEGLLPFSYCPDTMIYPEVPNSNTNNLHNHDNIVDDRIEEIPRNDDDDRPALISRINSLTSMFKDGILEHFNNGTPNFTASNGSSPSLNQYFNFVKDLSSQRKNGNESSDDESDNPLAMASLENSLSPNFNQYLAELSDPIFSVPSTLPELSGTGYHLYNYYVQTVSKMISVSPKSQNDSNSFEKVLLPFAHQDKGVLFALLAWAGYCMGGMWLDEGKEYLKKAIEHVDESLVKHQNRRETIIFQLATLLVLCGAEIFRGDVKNWSAYLAWSWKILKNNGGIVSFNRSKEENFLSCNFAYHDILTSSSERGTYFPIEDYETIFNATNSFGKREIDPLLGTSKKLYKILGEISTLVAESEKILSKCFTNPDSDGKLPTEVTRDEQYQDRIPYREVEDESWYGLHSKNLQEIIAKCDKLEYDIDQAKPDTEDLIGLTDEELELQLTMFEALQLTAKLFIRQAIKRENPSSLRSQVLTSDLLQCIDITISTNVQASFVFPVFMAGIHCVTRQSQDEMRERVERFKHCYGGVNVERAQSLIEEVWKENPLGVKVVDWYAILKRLNWNMNFA